MKNQGRQFKLRHHLDFFRTATSIFTPVMTVYFQLEKDTLGWQLAYITSTRGFKTMIERNTTKRRVKTVVAQFLVKPTSLTLLPLRIVIQIKSAQAGRTLDQLRDDWQLVMEKLAKKCLPKQS